MTRKKRLGRGLEALLTATGEPVPGNQPASPHSATTATIEGAGSGVAQMDSVPARDAFVDADSTSDIVHVNVYEIEDNPFQPRRVFTESEIGSLAESLKEHDILQPILLRVVDGRYQLISGERRLRAAIKANWQTIPARVRTADDRLVSELAIVENLQRKDLNPIEKALSFRRYLDEHQSTQEDLAGRLKIDRSTIANLMRLLELPSSIQDGLQAGRLSAGHARALLPLGEEAIQIEFCERIIAEGMSVRATERAVADKIAAEDQFGVSPATRRRRNRDKQIEALQQELKQALGTRVQIKNGNGQRGQIVVHFSDASEFERLRGILTGNSHDFRAA